MTARAPRQKMTRREKGVGHTHDPHSARAPKKSAARASSVSKNAHDRKKKKKHRASLSLEDDASGQQKSPFRVSRSRALPEQKAKSKNSLSSLGFERHRQDWRCAAPSPRVGAAAALDSSRSRAVRHGVACLGVPLASDDDLESVEIPILETRSRDLGLNDALDRLARSVALENTHESLPNRTRTGRETARETKSQIAARLLGAGGHASAAVAGRADGAPPRACRSGPDGLLPFRAHDQSVAERARPSRSRRARAADLRPTDLRTAGLPAPMRAVRLRGSSARSWSTVLARAFLTPPHTRGPLAHRRSNAPISPSLESHTNERFSHPLPHQPQRASEPPSPPVLSRLHKVGAIFPSDAPAHSAREEDI